MLSLFAGKLFCSLISYNHLVWDLPLICSCFLISSSRFLEWAMKWFRVALLTAESSIFWSWVLFFLSFYRVQKCCGLLSELCFPPPPSYDPFLLFIFIIPVISSDATPSSYRLVWALSREGAMVAKFWKFTETRPLQPPSSCGLLWLPANGVGTPLPVQLLFPLGPHMLQWVPWLLWGPATLRSVKCPFASFCFCLHRADTMPVGNLSSSAFSGVICYLGFFCLLVLGFFGKC